MKRVENITREQVTKLIVKLIKECAKNMGNSTNIEVGIGHSNWINGNKKWAYSEIRFGGCSYIFKDKEITEYDFIRLLENALKESGVKGKVFYDVCGDGIWTSKQAIFRRLEIFAKPCKEFRELNKVLVKNGSKEIGEFDVYSVRVCGKRSIYNDSGKYSYLCHDSVKCQSVIDFIKDNKGRNGVVKTSVVDYLDKGDEEDYRIAQYQESEWYGRAGANLKVNIIGGKGKKDYENTFGL